MNSPCCLTIAGSDSGGNAGVQADLRTFHAYCLHGCTVFAALTAQNPFGVTAIHSIPDTFVAAQLDAVLGTYTIQALKTGMLAHPSTINIIASKLREYPKIAKVIDPVMIATSGAPLITSEAIEALKLHLLPLATVITPNLPEAEILSGKTITDDYTAREVAMFLAHTYKTAVIIKGGHRENAIAEDLLYDGTTFYTFSAPRIENPISTHGTGCTFAAALTAELALEHSLPRAVQNAKKHVYNAISNAYLVGHACGVLGFVN